MNKLTFALLTSIELLQKNNLSQDALTKLELLQQLKQTEDAELEEPAFQLVVIALDGELYGIRILTVREILKVPRITWMPCTPEYLVGVISVRGEIHAVINLKNFLALGTSHVTEQSRIIIVESGELAAGFLIDEMVDIIEVPESSLLPLTESSLSVAQQYVEGKLRRDEQMLTLLHVASIIQNVVVDQT